MSPRTRFARMAILVALIASCVPAMPALAEGYPATTTRQFAHTQGESPTIPRQWQDGAGNIYTYQSEETGLAPGQTLSIDAQRQVELDTGLVDDPRSELAATLDVDEDGYAGTLSLSDSIVEPSYESRSRMVDRTVVYGDLPDNDVTQLPKRRCSPSLPTSPTARRPPPRSGVRR